jgi:hypothetical protein
MEVVKMLWVEIIETRSIGIAHEMFKQDLIQSMTKVDQEKDLKKIKIYRHATVDTDLSIHLYWESEKAEKRGSTLGLHLSSYLKEFGRVNHSIWIEEEIK